MSLYEKVSRVVGGPTGQITVSIVTGEPITSSQYAKLDYIVGFKISNPYCIKSNNKIARLFEVGDYIYIYIDSNNEGYYKVGAIQDSDGYRHITLTNSLHMEDGDVYGGLHLYNGHVSGYTHGLKYQGNASVSGNYSAMQGNYVEINYTNRLLDIKVYSEDDPNWENFKCIGDPGDGNGDKPPKKDNTVLFIILGLMGVFLLIKRK